MASIHSGHRSRVKTEFLARGMEGWADHRVLELLLFYAIPQGDVNGLSHALIDRFGSLSGVFDAPLEELKRVPGVGDHTAVLIKMIPSVAGRYVSDRAGRGTIIERTEDAVRELRPYFYGALNEMVYVLCTDGKGKLLGVRKVSEGCVESAEINIRRTVEEAMALRAVRIYLAHNHISNLAMPSHADWAATDELRSILGNIGLTLVDHIVFVDDDAVSLRETDLYSGRKRYNVF
jgi:DNA repair protein RadC